MFINIFKKAFIILSCGLIFFGASYAYLDYNINKSIAKADQKEYGVPYERIPENKSITFVFDDNSALQVYLDFAAEGIELKNIDTYNKDESNSDYTVIANEQLIEGIINRVGGINLETNDSFLRYTGAQVLELISYRYSDSLKAEIITAVFEQITKNSFTKADFVYIIENSKTDLKITDCIYWIDYIKEMSRKTHYVN